MLGFLVGVASGVGQGCDTGLAGLMIDITCF